MLILLLDQHKA